MSKDLERDLGLYATITISIGAMVGSGLFVLPGLAFKIAGPAIILAYLLAGLLVLPAALSKSEMATAMPESGGTYLYIDRAMGPLPGTIAGIGAWFSLVFKSAFAMVGLGAYLLVFVNLSVEVVTLIALGIATLLIVVNLIGVKQTGRLQATVVTLVLFALLLYVLDGITFVDNARYHPFFKYGTGGLFAATGFVFVSYAGVTKIASVAEEVENPGRNLPIGMLSSVLVMLVIYTLVVFVIVGVTPVSALSGTLTPMAVAAGQFAGQTGRIAIGIVAVLALASMANAGLLSSTRYPLAMSRDHLAPEALGRINDRFRTPSLSILFTGALLVFLIAVVPVRDLAKLASAFKILIFSFINVALIAFRESGLEWYDPAFTSPGYPWVQLFGLVGGLLLLTQMGPVAIGGAIGIIVVGILWYRLYGRERTAREGAAVDAIRRTTGDTSLDRIRTLLSTGGAGGIMVAVDEDTEVAREATLLRVAASLIRRRGGQINISLFEELPEQLTLSTAASQKTPAEEEFELETNELASDLGVPVTIDEVVAHDLREAVAQHVKNADINLVVGAWEPELFHGSFLDADIDWYMRHVDCDFVFVRDYGLENVEEIAVVADRGTYTPLEILVADSVATDFEATLRLVHFLDDDATTEQEDALAGYLDAVTELLTVPTAVNIRRGNDRTAELLSAAGSADLIVTSTAAHHLLYDVVFGTVADTLATELDSTVLMVHENEPRRSTVLRYVLERYIF